LGRLARPLLAHPPVPRANPSQAVPTAETRPRRGHGSGAWRFSDTEARPRPRVLIVDDHEDTREMYAWCMRAGGWVVEGVADGAAAVRVAPEFAPDAVVLDLHLPGLNGLEVTRRLRRDGRTKHVAIVVCTGLDTETGGEAARMAGCDEFVRKPIEPDSLREMVEALVLERPPPPT
jgi:CheY-like chemotaxis protein